MASKIAISAPDLALTVQHNWRRQQGRPASLMLMAGTWRQISCIAYAYFILFYFQDLHQLLAAQYSCAFRHNSIHGHHHGFLLEAPSSRGQL